MKLLIKIVVGIIFLVVVAVIAVFFFLDSIARGAIESGATYALGVPTTLAKADVRLLRGEFSMSGLDVANPEGFDSDLLPWWPLLIIGAGIVVLLSALSRRDDGQAR